jgi:hypothetical protein
VDEKKEKKDEEEEENKEKEITATNVKKRKGTRKVD